MLGTAFKTVAVFITLLGLTVGCLAFFLFTFYAGSSPQVKVIAQIQTDNYNKPSPTPSNANSRFTLLDGIIFQQLAGSNDTFSIVVKNLDSGERYTLNESRVYKTASLYKLWVMATAYRQIENGTLQKNSILSENVTELNRKHNIASESAEKTEGTITLAVSDALERMITHSENYAALLLSSKVRLSEVTKFLEAYGFSDSKVGSTLPTTTATDIALFYEKLYNNQLAHKTSTSEMITLLKRQQINRKLPRYLPADTVIAHKTGELDRFTHDAGIVYSPGGNYLIVVLAESSNPPAAEERISRVSESVYNFITFHATD